MARILARAATGLTIVALFRTAFEAFDIFETSRSQDLTLRKLKLRLNIEKCRLYLWGESMGLTDISEDGREPQYDDGLRFPRAVRNILEDLVRLFQNAEKLKDKYGYTQVDTDTSSRESDRLRPPDSPYAPSSDLIGSSNFSQVTRITQTVTWLVYDRRKFHSLIEEIRFLIDRLKEVTTPPAVLDGTDEASRRSFGRVRDTEALALVAGVCAADHPDVLRLRRQGPLLYRSRRGGDGGGYSRSTRYRYGNPRL